MQQHTNELNTLLFSDFNFHVVTQSSGYTNVIVQNSGTNSYKLQIQIQTLTNFYKLDVDDIYKETNSLQNNIT